MGQTSSLSGWPQKRKEQAKKRKEQDSKKPSGWLGKLMKRDKPQERIEVELTLIPLGGPEEEEGTRHIEIFHVM